MMDFESLGLPDLARRWKLRSVAVFGSVARGDDGPDSDLDLLIEFHSDATWSLHDVARLKADLEDRACRSVDLVERDALVNPYRRRSILRDARTLYAAE